MSDDHLEERVRSHDLYFEARQQVNNYNEKLALLDGATVSLVVTAALGKFLGVLRHKYTLGVALTSLVAAMLALLYRNLLATQVEFPEAQLTAYPGSEQKQRQKLRRSKSMARVPMLAGEPSISLCLLFGVLPPLPAS